MLQLILGFQGVRLELFTLFRLYLVIIHGLVDQPQVVTELFLMMKLLIYPFNALFQPHKVIYIMYLLTQNLRLLPQPCIQLIRILLYILWQLLLEPLPRASHEIYNLSLHPVQIDSKYPQLDQVRDLQLQLVSPLRHIRQIVLYRLCTVLNVGVREQLVHIRLRVLPIYI